VVADLGEQLAPGIARGRVLLYAGIDCNSLLPSVLKFWNETAEQKAGLDLGASRTNQVRVSSKFQAGDEVQFGGNSLLEGDDEDRPPLIDLCVGREAEQDIIEAAPAKVLFITGIGGQGKSTLAANYFSKMQRERSFQYFIWRDCKEQAERFENQLASVIEVLSNGLLKGQTLAKQPIETLIEILEALLRDISVLFVFDNVDHYVNLTAGTLTAAADLFLKAFVSSGTSSRAIFTCRPDVRYAGPNYLSLRLEGLSAEATLELFLKRKADSPRESVLRAHRLTGGHAFWLDLLAHQVTRGNSNTALETLLDDAESNSGDEANSTLRAIWRSLRDNEKAVLRFMAETVRPETDLKLAEYLRAEMNVNRLTKSIRSLKRQNLLVIKQAKSGEEFLELHPIVRQFVRTNFTIGERSKIITTIFLVYQRFMVKYRDEIRSKPTFTVLQHWTQAAELALEAGRLQDAINSLADSGDAFASSTYPREYIRAARMLFDSFDWVRESTKYKHFDPVFRVYVRTLTYLGEYREADELLDQFALTVLEEDSRFLFYCAVRTFHGWQKGSFEEAVEWGRKGLAIIKATGVDVEVEIEHSLALAERDAGRPEIALPMFLSGSTLSTVIDPDELDESRHGAFYGNIGRCLQFMDRADEALICYQKSALLVERSDSGEHAVNFGFARLWIGEVLLSKGQKRLALTFLEAARRRWQDVSPPLMRVVEALQEKLGEEAIELRDSSENVEKICRKWIFGAYLDSA
jgi:tetratricopeptide (TPR) repeat protein